MSPFAAYYGYMVGGVAMTGLLLGVAGGAVTWNARMHWLLGALLTAAAFVIVEVVRDRPRILMELWGFGVPPMAVSYFVSYAAARSLQMGAGWHAAWATLLALHFAIGAGLADMFLYRFHPAAAGVAAIAVGAAFVLTQIRRRKSVEPGAGRPAAKSP